MTHQPAPDAFGASFDEAAAEAVLSGTAPAPEPLAGALLALRGAGGRDAPAPSAELAALLGGPVVVDELARRRRAARLTFGVVLAGTATLTLSGVAAAHDALPGPAQRVVTTIVNDLTPFSIDVPRPSRPTPAHVPVVPAGSPSTGSPGTGAPAMPTDERRPGDGSGSGGRSGGPSGDEGHGSGGGSRDGSGSHHGGGSGDGSGGGSGDGGGGSSGGSGGSSGGGGSDGGSSGGGGSDDGSSGGGGSGGGGSDGGCGGADSGSDSGSGGGGSGGG